LFKALCVGLLLVGLSAAAQGASTCQASASLKSRNDEYTSQGANFLTYDLTITNVGSCSITSVQLQFTLPSSSSLSQFWNLAAGSNATSYNLTNFGNSLAANSSYGGAGLILQFASNSAVNISVMVEAATCACASSSNNSSANGSTSSTGSSNSTSNSTTSSNSSLPFGTFNATLFNSSNPAVSQALLLQLFTAPTEVEREALLSDQQFVFDFGNSMTGITKNAGGRTVAATPTNFAALIGHGVAMTVGFIEPCGINLPHTHPRATEINFIVQGTFLAGFFQENGARFIGNVLQPGMATVFPRGAIHFELNLGCQPAMFVAAFNNEDPGVQTTSLSFFGLPRDIVQSSLNISSIQTIDDLAAHLPGNPAVAMQACMQACGLSS